MRDKELYVHVDRVKFHHHKLVATPHSRFFIRGFELIFT